MIDTPFYMPPPHGLTEKAVWRPQIALAPHNSFRIGGQADIFFQPTDKNDIQTVLRAVSAPLHWLGFGSNVLVGDDGVRGIVLCSKRMNRLTPNTNGIGCYAEAGVPCPHIARYAKQCGLDAFGFLSGIPGSVGGALRMNAGAYGSAVWQFVAFADCIDTHGTVHRITPSDITIGYRSIQMPAGWAFIGAQFDVSQPPEKPLSIAAALAHRRATQPTKYATCGSVFRNPDGAYAGRLIEAAGLKGHAIGGVRVSPKHANFIESTAGATAADIRALCTYIHTTVFAKTGIRLLPEVRLFGTPHGTDSTLWTD